jgi:hypothetical protein
MRPWLLVILLCLSSLLQAQTWSEWFEQRKTQIRYLKQQIAALQVYMDYVAKGYNIAKDGLTAIRQVKQGDWQMHDERFVSLKTVSSRIGSSSKVASVVAINRQIIKETKEALITAKESGVFTSSEIKETERVINNLLRSCNNTIDDLMAVVTSGELTLTDDERIKRIEMLHQEMQNHYTFCVSYCTATILLLQQRKSAQTEIQYSQKVNEEK